MKRYFSYKNLRLNYIYESKTVRGTKYYRLEFISEFDNSKDLFFIFQNHFKLFENLRLKKDEIYNLFGFITSDGLLEYKNITCIKKIKQDNIHINKNRRMQNDIYKN